MSYPPPPARGVLASQAGVFRGAGISSLPTVGDEIRAPLKTPAWEGGGSLCHTFVLVRCGYRLTPCTVFRGGGLWQFVAIENCMQKK